MKKVKAKKLSLLERVQEGEFTKRKGENRAFSPEELEVVCAYLNDRITLSGCAIALGCSRSGNIGYWVVIKAIKYAISHNLMDPLRLK